MIHVIVFVVIAYCLYLKASMSNLLGQNSFYGNRGKADVIGEIECSWSLPGKHRQPRFAEPCLEFVRFKF